MRCKQFIIVSLAGVVLAASLASCGGAVPASSAAASSVAASSVMVSSAAAETALPDGVYTADFETDSSMFHPNEACNGKGTLTVENGVMTFHVSLASKKIVNLYPGLAADAEANKTAWLIPTVDTVTYADGTTEEVYGYDIPVEALDTDFQLALLGTKGKWYDHTVSVRNAEPKTEQAVETPRRRRIHRCRSAGGRLRPRHRGKPCCPDCGRGQDDRHHRVEQPQLRLHDRGWREVSAHQHRGQLHL